MLEEKLVKLYLKFLTEKKDYRGTLEQAAYVFPALVVSLTDLPFKGAP